MQRQAEGRDLGVKHKSGRGHIGVTVKIRAGREPNLADHEARTSSCDWPHFAGLGRKLPATKAPLRLAQSRQQGFEGLA